MASVLANSNVSLNAIASVLGRSIDDIGRYVKSLNTETELATALENIYMEGNKKRLVVTVLRLSSLESNMDTKELSF